MLAGVFHELVWKKFPHSFRNLFRRHINRVIGYSFFMWDMRVVETATSRFLPLHMKFHLLTSGAATSLYNCCPGYPPEIKSEHIVSSFPPAISKLGEAVSTIPDLPTTLIFHVGKDQEGCELIISDLLNLNKNGIFPTWTPGHIPFGFFSQNNVIDFARLEVPFAGEGDHQYPHSIYLRSKPTPPPSSKPKAPKLEPSTIGYVAGVNRELQAMFHVNGRPGKNVTDRNEELDLFDNTTISVAGAVDRGIISGNIIDPYGLNIRGPARKIRATEGAVPRFQFIYSNSHPPIFVQFAHEFDTLEVMRDEPKHIMEAWVVDAIRTNSRP